MLSRGTEQSRGLTGLVLPCQNGQSMLRAGLAGSISSDQAAFLQEETLKEGVKEEEKGF